MSQQAGRDGVATILEKLFLTIKFDILGTDIVSVEITEDFVLGKSSPIYHHASKKLSCLTNRNPHQHGSRSHQNGLDAILEEASSPLSDYELGVFEDLEIWVSFAEKRPTAIKNFFGPKNFSSKSFHFFGTFLQKKNQWKLEELHDKQKIKLSKHSSMQKPWDCKCQIIEIGMQ